MLILNFNPFPVITTERLVLRKATIDDANEVFFLRSDADVIKYIDRAPAQNTDEAVKFIQMITDNLDKNEGISWTLSLKGDPKMIGSIGLWRIEKEHYRAEIGYVLHPDHQGKGFMQEALKAVVNYGFNTMNLHSIEANINPFNIASQKLLEKGGFVKEAHFKENYYYNGVFSDSAIYSLLAPKNAHTVK